MCGPSYVKRMLHGSELEGSLTIRPFFVSNELACGSLWLLKTWGRHFLHRWSAENVVVGPVVNTMLRLGFLVVAAM